jgi:hypothetical protein
MTNRYIMEVFIYGGLAHSTKKAIYDGWAQNDTVLAMLEFGFVGTLVHVFDAIQRIRMLNEQVLQELRAKVS